MPSFTRRKILVASLGVATISYAIGCSDSGVTSGNMPSPGPFDAGADADAAYVHDAGQYAVDGASSDAAVDATPDAEADASPDANPDGATDASNDAAANDASADASSGD